MNIIINDKYKNNSFNNNDNINSENNSNIIMINYKLKLE